MSITFPTTLDSLSNPASTDTLASPSHSDQHSDSNDAVEALEAKVGADSSAVTGSHDYKLSGVTGTDKASSIAGTETLTNKTLTSPVLNMEDSMPSTNVRCSVRLSSSQGTDGAPTVEFDTEDFDTGSDFNTSTYIFTAPVAGYYLITASVELSSGSDQATCILRIMKNGGEAKRSAEQSSGTGVQGVNVTAILSLAVDDTINFQVYTSSTMTVQSASQRSYAMIHLLST